MDNYVAALDTVERDASLRDAALALCAGLSRHWLLIGAFAEGRRRLEPHARKGDGDADRLVRVLGGSALLALNDNDGAAFIAQARRAVEVSNDAADAWTIAFAAVCESAALSIVPEARGRRDGKKIHERARRLAEETADAWLLTYVEFCEAGRAAERGDEKAALLAEEVAFVHARTCGDHFLIYAIALYLANLLEHTDTRRAAWLVLESANALEPSNLAGLAACLECAVRLAVHQKRYDEAIRLMGTAAGFRESALVPAWRCDPDEYRELLAKTVGSDAFESTLSVGRDLSFAEATEEIRRFVAGSEPQHR